MYSAVLPKRGRRAVIMGPAGLVHAPQCSVRLRWGVVRAGWPRSQAPVVVQRRPWWFACLGLGEGHVLTRGCRAGEAPLRRALGPPPRGSGREPRAGQATSGGGLGRGGAGGQGQGGLLGHLVDVIDGALGIRDLEQGTGQEEGRREGGEGMPASAGCSGTGVWQG